MSDPKLKTASVQIKYSSDDGYSTTNTIGLRKMGLGQPDPGQALTTAIHELSRLTALFGLEDEALTAFNSARDAKELK